MTESTNSQDENQDEIESIQVSTGPAQRQPPQAPRAAAAAQVELSPAELEERQRLLGETRRSGPPLAPAESPRALAAALPNEVVEPTEVEEP